jgi:soluble lytic murein transglycosylase-like protein
MVRAIRQQESGGNFSARGGSGEFGAYQFMPDTWKAWAQQYLGDANAQPDKNNQNKVAYMRVAELKNKGLNPGQIAASWNAGIGSLRNDAWKQRVGVNKFGQRYDTPGYVRKVYSLFKQFRQQA